MKRLLTFGRRLDEAAGQPAMDGPDWKQANPKRIGKALERALALPSGGWYVVGASRSISSEPHCVRICDQHLVTWRGDDGVHVAPNDCPHMGASLADGVVPEPGSHCRLMTMVSSPGFASMTPATRQPTDLSLPLDPRPSSTASSTWTRSASHGT
jgi:hypothetical protein